MSEFKLLFKKWKSTIFVGLLIFALALALRLISLTYLPVFADEAIYIRWAQIMKAETTLRFLPQSDGKQPLFMWIVILFFKVASNPLVAGRLVSVLTGMGTMIGIFLLSFLLFKSKKASLAAIFIYAISPFSVFFDRIGLVDSMLGMFGVWTLYFGILTAKFLRLDLALITGFFLGGALLTKSPALFFSLLLPSTWILSKWPKRNKKRLIHFGKLAMFFSPIYLIGYGMFNILRLGPNFHLLSSRNADYVHPISHLWTNPLDPFISHFSNAVRWFWQIGPSVLLVFIVVGVFMGIKRKSKEVLLLTVWMLVPILVQSMYARVFTTRYILFSLSPAIILASYLFTDSAIKGVFQKKIVTVGFLILVVHALRVDYLLLTNVERALLPRTMRSGYLEEWTSGTGIKEAADYIRGQAEGGKRIVVGTEGYFGTLPDGLQMYLNDLREVTVIGVGLWIVELPNQLAESKSAGNETYLVINNSRLKGDPEKMGLKLIAAYPKVFRLEGTREYLQEGPQEVLYLFEVRNE